MQVIPEGDPLWPKGGIGANDWKSPLCNREGYIFHSSPSSVGHTACFCAAGVSALCQVEAAAGRRTPAGFSDKSRACLLFCMFCVLNSSKTLHVRGCSTFFFTTFTLVCRLFGLVCVVVVSYDRADLEVPPFVGRRLRRRWCPIRHCSPKVYIEHILTA